MTALQLFSLVPFVAMLGIAAVIDWRQRRIPNWLTGLMVASGAMTSLLPASFVTPGQAGLGLLVGFFIPFVLFAMGALGGGDVKLLAGVGIWLGPLGVIKVFLAECIIGMIIVLVQSIQQRRLSALLRNSTVLTVNLINMDTIGADALCETGKACRSIERPLPYAVPVLIATLILLALSV